MNKTGGLLIAHEWEAFLKRYGDRRDTAAKIIYDVFGLKALFESENAGPGELLAGLKEVIFPDFLENPFIARDERGSFFRLTFRVVGADDVSFVSTIPLYMKKNPFGKQQFFFKID